MATITATTPGLLYDPRSNSTSKFFEALQKELDKMQSKRGKPFTLGNPKPLPDPGRPGFVNFAKPGVPPLSFAFRV